MYDNDTSQEPNQKTLDITIEDIFKVASGLLEDKSYASACSISINKQISEDDILTTKNVYINAPTYFYCYRGCVTVVMDFGQREIANFNQATNVCLDYIKKEDTLLLFNIVPLSLNGDIVIALTNLVYVDFYIREDHTRRLILCFDNTATTLIGTDEIDVAKIREMAAYEVKKEQDDLDNEIAALDEEGERLEEELAATQYTYDYNTLVYEESEEEEEEGGMRIVKTKDQLRRTEEDI